MRINDVEFNADLDDILTELIAQMRANNIQYMQKQASTSTHIQVCCPYHANGLERRPSAGIRRSDGIFHCFACGTVHSLPEVISFCLGHENDILGKFGWNWLLKNFATLQVEERHDITLNFERFNNNSGVSNLPDNTADTQTDNSGVEFVSEEELDRYRYTHPYWAKRGITNDAIIELFDLGYDRETDCITFPVRDKNGNCLFVARRSVHTKFFNYPSGAEKPIYGLYEIEQTRKQACSAYYIMSKRGNGKTKFFENLYTICICESMIDCLRLWQNGHFAVALNGLGSEKQFEQLRNYRCRHYILATDSDKAGMKARENIRKQITNKIITEYILPEGRKDIGECTDDEIRNLEEVF